MPPDTIYQKVLRTKLIKSSKIENHKLLSVACVWLGGYSVFYHSIGKSFQPIKSVINLLDHAATATPVLIFWICLCWFFYFHLNTIPSDHLYLYQAAKRILSSSLRRQCLVEMHQNLKKLRNLP